MHYVAKTGIQLFQAWTWNVLVHQIKNVAIVGPILLYYGVYVYAFPDQWINYTHNELHLAVNKRLSYKMPVFF